MSSLTPPKFQRAISIVFFILFIGLGIIRYFYPGFGDLPMGPNEEIAPIASLTPRPVAVPATSCEVTINGLPAVLLGNGVNPIIGHDEIDVVCPDSSVIRTIFVSKPGGLDGFWMYPSQNSSGIFSYKTYGKDLGNEGAASVNISGFNNDELDIYIFDLEN